MQRTLEIIILNWNGWDDTRACLRSLLPTLTEGMHVTVIDNVSIENQINDLATEFPSVTCIRNTENVGFVGGNNQILSSVVADYYLLLNDDTEVLPDSLKNLITTAESDPKIGIVGPIINNIDGSIQSAGSCYNLWTGSTSPLRQIPTETTEVPMVSGCCFLIKGELIKEIGILEPAYFAYYEETDFCARAKRAGWKSILTPKTSITHKGGTSLEGISNFSESQLIKNRFIFIKKNGSVPQRITTFLYVTFFYLWARSLKILLTQKGKTIPALWRGYFQGLTSF